MNTAAELLSSILSRSEPDETIWHSMDHPMQIAKLDERELGSLSRVIQRLGAVRALEKDGLFERKVVVCKIN